MTWFRPGSPEPLHKFELIGLLVSLAVYNGITLPVTFPTALYDRLLSIPITSISQISDGWPDLAKGLQALVDWEDGDVGDVFMRTYEFSFEGIGETIHVDMESAHDCDSWYGARPTSIKEAFQARLNMTWDHQTVHQEKACRSSIRNPAGLKSSQRAERNPSLVTNRNRVKYISDYISWLTDKSVRPQYKAFARGFYTCFDNAALAVRFCSCA